MSLTKATYSMIKGAVINVLDYGATGDGVADDTAEIQAAFNAAGLGDYVYFPPGTYLVSSKITFACSFGGKFGVTVDNPNLTPWNGTIIKYSGSGTCFEASEQLYGAIIENFGLELTTTGLIGIDFKFGGNLNWIRKLKIRATNPVTPANYGIYLRGINPDTSAPNFHQHSNKFEHITVYGNMLTGIKLGDEGSSDALANGNYIDHWVEYLDPPSPTAAKAIYINGYGSVINHPVLSGNGATIRFYGQCGNNAICGGYFDSVLTTAIYVDADIGQRYVFNAFGCQGLTSAKITDTIEPAVSQRYVVAGEYTRLPEIYATKIREINSGDSVEFTNALITPWAKMVPQLSAGVPNRSIFVKSSDEKLYYKDNAGVEHALY
jgi:hypothetical protein